MSDLAKNRKDVNAYAAKPEIPDGPTAESLERELNAANARIRILESAILNFRTYFTSYMLGKIVDGVESMHTMKSWGELCDAARDAEIALAAQFRRKRP